MTESKPPDGTQGTGLTDDIFGTSLYQAQVPATKQFLPWHRPRKQFVRHRQWCGEIGKLLDDFARDSEPLRYLGLPGVDLIDLRCIHGLICEPRNLGLRFLGFNSGARPGSASHTDLNISLDEVRKLALVDPQSDVIGDDFSRLSNQESVAWRRAHDSGPYDVINLDLCDGFGAHPPSLLDDTHYNAVNSLLSLQARKKHPWLLLLTTRAGRAFVHDDVLQILLNQYLQNLAGCPAFREASAEKLGITTEDELAGAMDDPKAMLHLFLVGLSKWLIGLAIAQRPPSKVEVRSTIGYRVQSGAACEDLISLAIRFEPTFIPVADRTGLAKRGAKVPDECESSVHAFRRIASRKDADALLAANAELRAEMISSTAALLELARYDIAAYHAWLQLSS
jgi:hypothetical protein